MKNNFTIRIFLVFAILFPVYSQDTFEEFLKQQQQAQQQAFEDELSEFQNYVAEVTSQYDAYEQQQAREFEAFKKAVEEKWQDFKAPSKKEYVEYDDDLDSRASIDFEKGEITVEVIVEEDIPDPVSQPVNEVENNVPKQETKQAPIRQMTQEKKKDTEPKSLKSIVEKTKTPVSQKEKPQQRSPEVKKKISDQKLQRKLADILKAKGDDGKPMLNKQVVDKKGKTVTPATAKAYASELVANAPVATKTYKAKDGKKRTVYTVKVPMKSTILTQGQIAINRKS